MLPISRRSSWSRLGARTAHPRSRKCRLSSPMMLADAKVLNMTPRSGSKRSAALTRAREATWTRSSRDSPRLANRRASWCASPRCDVTSRSRNALAPREGEDRFGISASTMAIRAVTQSPCRVAWTTRRRNGRQLISRPWAVTSSSRSCSESSRACCQSRVSVPARRAPLSPAVGSRVQRTVTDVVVAHEFVPQARVAVERSERDAQFVHGQPQIVDLVEVEVRPRPYGGRGEPSQHDELHRTGEEDLNQLAFRCPRLLVRHGVHGSPVSPGSRSWLACTVNASSSPVMVNTRRICRWGAMRWSLPPRS